MSINNNVNNANNKAQVDASKLAQAQFQSKPGNPSDLGEPVRSNNPARQDSVSLTQSAQQLANVQKKGTEAPVNQEKVDRLKKAIANGDYQVNPESLAKKIAVLETQIFGAKA